MGVERYFAETVGKAPDATAVSHDGVAWSYRELDERSSRLANELGALGVEVGDRVGVCVDRGLEVPTTVLGVLKSGAAYVPLDPAYPPARLRIMASDSAVRLIVASGERAGLFGATARIRIVDELMGRSPRPPGRPRPQHQATAPDSPAYIIYTSGSTGRPNGVVMPHRALANLIGWQIREPGFGEPVRTIQFTPLSFDVHFQEMFTTWSTGGELVLLGEVVRRDASRLLEFLADEEIERIFLPFVALQELAGVAVTQGPLPTSLRDVVTAGEQLQVNRAVADLFTRLPGCRLHNHYGPSESHVVATHTLRGPPSEWPTLPPIGRPIDGARIHLLDASLRPVRRGTPGELCIAGDCLATGYWNRPRLTDERFVGAVDGTGQMYRSGDLARLTANGELEYLGRIDSQVKIRGHRVETGEVEAVIASHPAVRECVVNGVGEQAGERRLVAYLVLDSSIIEDAALKESLVADRIREWQEVWQETYLEPHEVPDPMFDLAGWRSSYTGEPLNADDMEGWVQGSVERVLAKSPSSVLEIGCGTGLLLHRLAPRCERYHGIDFSEAAINALRPLEGGARGKSKVTLEVMEAIDIDRLAGRNFDTVVMNSVTQHLPDQDYLTEVLTKACDLVVQGQVFVGDLTDGRLREAFIADVEISQAGAAESLDTLLARVEKRLATDQELVVDPEFFYRLPQTIPSIQRVEVQLKPGRYHNELSAFRYDVMLHVDRASWGEAPPVEWFTWDGSDTGPSDLVRLASRKGAAVGIRGVPNPRVSGPVATLEALRSTEAETLRAFREVDQPRSEGPAIEPQDFWDRAAEAGCGVEVFGSEDPSRFDVLVHPKGDRAKARQRSVAAAEHPLGGYTSQPLNSVWLPHVVRELRELLGKTLPDYMIPARYELLARLPTTPSGKVDRRALPQPGRDRPPLDQEFVAPRGPTENALAELWCELLDLTVVGADDSFFDLGGNSILSVRLAIVIRERLARELRVVTLFEHPTIRLLAAHLDGRPESAPEELEVAERARRQVSAFRRGRSDHRKDHG